MPLTLGSRLGAYEILAPLGAGAMGEVYRVRDNRLGREVAVKVPILAADQRLGVQNLQGAPACLLERTVGDRVSNEGLQIGLPSSSDSLTLRAAIPPPETLCFLVVPRRT